MLETIRSVFWDNGYSATSLDDIMQSTGLGKGSLYGAYGSKQEMYLLAFTDYCDWAVADLEERLRGNDADAIVRLRAYIQTAAKGGANARRGCMLAKGTAEVAGRFPDVDKIIERTAGGFHARVVQHECDHLDGRLYPSRMADLGKLVFESEIRHFMAAQ